MGIPSSSSVWAACHHKKWMCCETSRIFWILTKHMHSLFMHAKHCLIVNVYFKGEVCNSINCHTPTFCILIYIQIIAPTVTWDCKCDLVCLLLSLLLLFHCYCEFYTYLEEVIRLITQFYFHSVQNAYNRFNMHHEMIQYYRRYMNSFNVTGHICLRVFACLLRIPWWIDCTRWAFVERKRCNHSSCYA